MIKFLSLRGTPATRQSIITLLWIASLTLAMTAVPALAQEAEQDKASNETTHEEEKTAEEPQGYTYSPDFCEFSATFPSAPYTSRRCEGDDQERCYDLVSFTQVYEMSATINLRVICNPVDSSVYKDYSREVMAATLRAMTRKTVVEEFNSGFREEDGYKQAGLAGGGTVGRMPMIYIAQMWVGKHSAMTVEAELIGQAHDAADTLFSDILKTIHYSGVKTLEPPVKTEAPKKD